MQEHGITVQKHAQAAKGHAEAMVESRSREDLIMEVHEHGLAVKAHLKAMKAYLSYQGRLVEDLKTR